MQTSIGQRILETQEKRNAEVIQQKRITIQIGEGFTLPELLTEQDSVNIKKVILLKCTAAGSVGYSGQVALGEELKLLRQHWKSDYKWLTSVQTKTGIHLGYLPMNKDQSVARLIDAGKQIKAVVIDSDDPEIARAKAKDQKNEEYPIALAVYMEIQEENDI